MKNNRQRTCCLILVGIVSLWCIECRVEAAEIRVPVGTRFTDTLPGRTGNQFPTWIEGTNGNLLLAFDGGDGTIRMARSSDLGRSWEVFSRVGFTSSYPYLTRLADGSLVMVVNPYNEKRTRRLIAWIQSFDNGKTWSKRTTIPIAFRNVFPYGPIIEMPDGRWAYCPYSQDEEKEFKALVVWSDNRGKNWKPPVVFPTPADGNRGLTEPTIAQVASNKYVAAIRADEGKTTRDGFYLSFSADGQQWSAPTALEDIGRMPRFYHVGDEWFLTYRQYAPKERTQFNALRRSKNGTTWSKPTRMGRGVNGTPALLRAGKKFVLFNNRYPTGERLVRRELRLSEVKSD